MRASRRAEILWRQVLVFKRSQRLKPLCLIGSWL
jgi:hypothetical protein